MDPEANSQLEHAKLIWEGLRSAGYGVPDAFLHLWRIVELATLARLLPDPQGRKDKVRVYSCISLAVTEDGDELRGVSSTARATMRFNQVHRHGPIGRYKETKDVWGAKGEGAFDKHNHPRLMMLLEEECAAKGEPMPTEPNTGHPYQSCAEQVAFEKVSRLGKTPKLLYTVQKRNRNDYVEGAPVINKYEVKVVSRCSNCMNFKDYMGHVVTDSEPLQGLHVPVVTKDVLQYFRDEVTEQSISDLPHSSKITTVWLHASKFGSTNVVDRVILPRIGLDGIRVEDEISRARQCQPKG